MTEPTPEEMIAWCDQQFSYNCDPAKPHPKAQYRADFIIPAIRDFIRAAIEKQPAPTAERDALIDELAKALKSARGYVHDRTCPTLRFRYGRKCERDCLKATKALAAYEASRKGKPS